MTTTAQGKTSEDIKIQLYRRGLTITDLAKRLRPRRHRNTVSQAIHHPEYFPKVHRQIKAYLERAA
jgi:hypothetical protein